MPAGTDRRRPRRQRFISLPFIFMDTSSPAPGLRLVDWPRTRNVVVDLLDQAHAKNSISACWEVDFTAAQARMTRIQRETGIAVSLNAYLIYALGRTAIRHPLVQAVRWKSRGKLALYDGVDVGTAVEWRRPGQPPVAVGARLAGAHTKSLAQICAEMRRLAKEDPQNRPVVRWRAKLARYPRWIRRLVWRWVDAHPARRRHFRGTIGLTNLNFLLDDRRPVFGFPLTPYTTTLCVGSIYERALPAATPPGFEFRRFLSLTLTVDHDILDGGVATRFGRALTFFIEAAEGLDDAFAHELRAAFPRKTSAP